MKLKLKNEYFEYYAESFINNICAISITENLITLELNNEPLIGALNPFLLKYLDRVLDSQINLIYHNSNYLGKTNTEGNKTYIQIKDDENQAQEDFKYLILELQDVATRLLAERNTPGFDAEILDESVIIQNKGYPLIHFENAGEPILETVVFTDREDFLALRKNNPQITQIKYAEDIFRSHYGNKRDEAFIVLYKDGLVIGVNHLFDSADQPGYFASSFTSIVESEQGKGYSKLILEKRIEFLKSINKGLHNSIYSSSGFNNLRPKTLELCSKYDLPLIENGLLGRSETFPQAVFLKQLGLQEKLRSAKYYKQESIYLDYSHVVINDIKDQIDIFLKYNVHDLDSREKQITFYNQYKKFLDEWDFKKIME